MRPQKRMWPFAMKSVDAGGVKLLHEMQREGKKLRNAVKGVFTCPLPSLGLDFSASHLFPFWFSLPYSFSRLDFLHHIPFFWFCFLCFTLLRFGFFLPHACSRLDFMCLTSCLYFAFSASQLVQIWFPSFTAFLGLILVASQFVLVRFYLSQN